MKRLMFVAAALYVATTAVGCNCTRCFNRGSACPPTCISAPVCAPTAYSDCCSEGSATVISGAPSGTVIESVGAPTPAGTVVTPGPVTYTP